MQAPSPMATAGLQVFFSACALPSHAPSASRIVLRRCAITTDVVFCGAGALPAVAAAGDADASLIIVPCLSAKIVTARTGPLPSHHPTHLEHGVEGRLDLALGLGVERGRRLVAQDELRAPQHGPRNGDALCRARGGETPMLRQRGRQAGEGAATHAAALR